MTPQALATWLDQHRPFCVMLVGLPGSGKSTFRKELVELLGDTQVVQVSSDDIVHRHAAETASAYSTAFYHHGDAAVKQATQAMHDAFKRRDCVIVDQVNPTIKARARKMASCAKEYTRVGVWLSTPDDVVRERLARRGIYGASVDVYEKMATSFEAPSANEFDYLFAVTS